MKCFAMAIALTCLMAVSTVAGDIPMVPGPPPPAPPAPLANTDGDMGAGGFAEQITDEFVLAIFGIFAS